MPGCRSGQRLGGRHGWTLLDRELMHQAAAIEHVPDAELESLDEQAIGVGMAPASSPAQPVHPRVEGGR